MQSLSPCWTTAQVAWWGLYGFRLLLQFLPHPVIDRHPVHFRIKVPFIPSGIEEQGSSPRMVSEHWTKTECWNVTIFQGFCWLNCPGTCWDVKNFKGMIITIYMHVGGRYRWLHCYLAQGLVADSYGYIFETGSIPAIIHSSRKSLNSKTAKNKNSS